MAPDNRFQPAFDIGAMKLDCGVEPEADGYAAVAEAWPAYAPVMDWSWCEPTPDQVAMNLWLSRTPFTGTAILHVGVGNSSAARLTAGKARSIDSVTVAVGEIAYARGLDLPGHTTHRINKYGSQFRQTFAGRSFDYILDNNLVSYVCCQRHAESYFSTLAEVLAPRGIIVTHRLGMRWTLDAADVERVWRLDEHKLRMIARCYGWDVARFGGLYFLGRPDTTAALDFGSHAAATMLRIRLVLTVFPSYVRMVGSFPRGLAGTALRAFGDIVGPQFMVHRKRRVDASRTVRRVRP